VEHGFDETVDVHAVDELRRNVQGYEPWTLGREEMSSSGGSNDRRGVSTTGHANDIRRN
jgi:hypothetical protein